MTCCRRTLAAFIIVAGLICGQQPGAELSQAMNLAAQGRFPEAEQAMRAIEKSHPNDFEVRYRLGLILLRQGKAADAITRFEAATKLASDSALAWLGLAQSRLKLGRRDQAVQAAVRAEGLGKAQPPVWRALAIFYADANDYARAAEFEEQWSRSPGADAESKARLCRLRVSAAQGKQAVQVCRAAVEKGETAGLQRLLGDAYRLAGDPPSAVDAYQRAINLDQARPEAYYSLVALFLDHRTPVPAIAVLESAVSRFPKETEFRRLLGLAHYQTGDFDKAISAFVSVLDVDPDAEAGYASLETLLTEAGPRLAEIIERLRGFRERRPSSPVGHFLLARALAARGRESVSDVEPLLKQAIQADSKFWPAHLELGRLFEARGQQDAAIQSLERAVKLNPDYAPAYYSLAQLYAQKGDRLRAVEYRKKHHQLLDRERVRAQEARAETPTLRFKIEPPAR